MASERQKTHYWADEETRFMLTRLKELNILKYMDGRKTRNADLFIKVSALMKEAGFVRTAEQIRVRWKHVKQTYQNAKKKNQTTGQSPAFCPFSDQLDELLGNRPLSQAADNEAAAGAEDFEEITVEERLPLESEDSISDPAFDGEWSRGRGSPPPPEQPTDSPPVDSPGTRLQQAGMRRRRRNAGDLDLVFQRMEEMNHFWRQQLQRSEEREERLVNSILQSNATVVSALLEGIRSLRPAAAAAAAAPPEPAAAAAAPPQEPAAAATAQRPPTSNASQAPSTEKDSG